MKPDRSIQIFHILLLLSVVAQLLTEQFMQVPEPNKQFDEFAVFLFSIHQFIGFVVLMFAIAYLMTVSGNSEHKNRLFPWLEADGRSALLAEIKHETPGWFSGKLSHPDQAHSIAGTVHGLGLILVTLLGVTGSMVYMGISHNGSMSAATHAIKEAHEILGTILWLFIAGHLLMTAMHQVSGHKVLQKIFFKQND